MSCCSGRYFLITIGFLQLIATVERQVFDFLGFMWAPIIGNFLQIIFVIVCLFGAFQYRPKFLVMIICDKRLLEMVQRLTAYAVWSLIWLGWNVFVICLYLEVGILTRQSEILNIVPGGKSWWLLNGIGCKVINSNNSVSTAQGPSENDITGCLIEYQYVEIIHAGIQCLFSLLGFTSAIYVIHVFTEEDDSSPAAQVNHEMEFIKMRYKQPPRKTNRSKVYETTTLQPTETMTSTPEPPRRQTIERTVLGPSERRSHRHSKRKEPKVTNNSNNKQPRKSPSKLSLWSKASSNANETNEPERRENLPWVHIAPSVQRSIQEVNSSLDSESSPPAYDSHEEYGTQNGSVPTVNTNPSAINAFGFNTDRHIQQPPAEPKRKQNIPINPRASTGRSRPRERHSSHSSSRNIKPADGQANRNLDYPDAVRQQKFSNGLPSDNGENAASNSSRDPDLKSDSSRQPSYSSGKLPPYPPLPLAYLSKFDKSSDGKSDSTHQPSYSSDRLPPFPQRPAQYTKAPESNSDRPASYASSDRLPLPPYPKHVPDQYSNHRIEEHNASYGTDYGSNRNDGYINAGYSTDNKHNPTGKPPVASNPIYSSVNKNRYNSRPPTNEYRGYQQQDSYTSQESMHSGNVFFRGQGASHV